MYRSLQNRRSGAFGPRTTVGAASGREQWLPAILVVFTLTFTCLLYAQDEAHFIYKSGGRKDPFVPLIGKDGKLLVTYGVINSINDVILEGIIYDPQGQSFAVLNGLIVKENDRVGTIRVKRIEQETVILIYEDKEYTFKLKEQS